MPKPIDLTKLTSQQLKNLLANAERKGEVTTTGSVLREMAGRGIATRREYRTLAWNQERVREVMKAFKDVASLVQGNRRTPYTEAGGLRIGHPKDDPEHLWVDTYCAIKTARINGTFGCYIKHPGDEPEFRMKTAGETIRVYSADELPDAFEQWQSIARIAATEGAMRARPVEGKIDYAELSREHIARYPKIRAALAE
jgi:hypothetical protein